jgi:biopolymer transport protein ExbB
MELGSMYAKTLMIASAFFLFLLSAGLNTAYAQDAAAPPGAPADAAPAADPFGAPAAPEAAAPSLAPETAVVENPYGIGHLWEEGDAVSKGILFILAVMSLGTWYIFVTKYWEQARVLGQA